MTTLQTIIATLLLALHACAQVQETLVIPRQSAEVVTPGPWQMADKSQPQRPGGHLIGKGITQTVLVFDPSITGQLIKTEGYGDGKVGRYWNQNNTDGDKSLRSTLSSIARDFTVDGRAEFRPYPMGPAVGWPQPPAKDLHGQDMPWRADGLCMQGSGNRAEHLRFKNIAGTALIMRPGVGTQAGFFGLWDDNYPIIDDINVKQAINGVDISLVDAKISRLIVENVAKEGAILDLNGGYLNTDHICGADVGCRVKSEINASNCYHESARIGTLIEPQAHGCEFDGLNIGPGTCTQYGIQAFSSGNRIKFRGTVGNPNGKHAQVVGLYSTGDNNTYDGGFRVENGDVGVRLEGNAGELKLVTFQPNGGTALEITKPINNWRISIRVQGYKNPVALNIKAMGTGNKIEIISTGETPSIVGKIPPGNEVSLNGVVQK